MTAIHPQANKKASIFRGVNRVRISDFVIAFIILLLSLTCILPFIHVAAKSLSSNTAVLSKSVHLWPKELTLDAYQAIFADGQLTYSLGYTIVVTVLFTAIGMVVTTFAAYPLAISGLKGKPVFAFILMFTMYFSGGMVPNFLTISAYGMYNTAWAIILPTAVSTYNMIVMRTTFAAVPEALRESAYIDGANDFVILYRIYIPVSKATMAVIILFYVVSQWNSWFPAMIYLRDSKKWPMILREILINDAAGGISDDADAQYLQELIKYCTIIVATVPILCIYPFVQKYFMKGVMLGSVKG